VKRLDRNENGGNLGTFIGVFTPSILTILGIILFLRLGYVVGNVGLRNALLIIAFATAVSTLTSLSLAAISTNMEVRGGGDYYLISRTLGIEFGGAIGIVLFLAQSVSVAFYAIGFGEAVAGLANFSGDRPVQLIATAAVVVLFVLAWLGADAASKFQTAVMVVLIAALLSFYIGAVSNYDSAVLAESWSAPRGGAGIFIVFAIFFPAVTGFTQGVSMSGDLRNPSKSLPTGTFAAVALSTVVYVTVAIFLAAAVALSALADNPSSLRSVSFLPVLIDAGVISATLSSAMAAFLGAPRILQSLASDRIFPVLNAFGKGHGPTNNPRRGVLLSLGIAVAAIGLGSLNVIAPVVSMFFLISYGLLNYATYYEAKASSPSFRPRFRFFHPRLSLLGALASFGAMVAINPPAGITSLLVLFGIYTYLGRRSHPERWSDASHSHYFRRAKENIRLMSGEAESSRNWRPQVLAFSADPARRSRLMQLAAWLEGASGLSAIVEIMQGSGAVKRVERLERQKALKAEANESGVDASLVVLAPDALEALPIVVQSYGVGPLRANTVLFGWPEQPGATRRHDYSEMLQEIVRLGPNVMAVSSDALRWGDLERVPSKKRRIDVWWKDNDSGRLALLTAYLVTRTPEWSRAAIRVLAVASEPGAEAAAEAELEAMLETVRIPAEVEIVSSGSQERIAAQCRTATMIFVPARLRRTEILDPIDEDLYTFFEQVPMAVAVVAGSPVDLMAGPESEEHSQIAQAEERVEATERRLARLEEGLSKATAEVETLRTKAAQEGSDEIEAQLVAAEDHHETVTRRTLKARAAADRAHQELATVLESNATS
jgi:amino acid transporter